MEKFFDLKLTEQEIQIVFNALLDRPFKEVFALIQKLQESWKEGAENDLREANPER